MLLAFILLFYFYFLSEFLGNKPELGYDSPHIPDSALSSPIFFFPSECAF
jgi:hypothetical protein